MTGDAGCQGSICPLFRDTGISCPPDSCDLEDGVRELPKLPYRWLRDESGQTIGREGGERVIAWRDQEDLTIGVLYVIRRVARSLGYAVAWHGSIARDLDLIAVPWTERAAPVEELLSMVKCAVGGEYTPQQENPSLRPHGRLAYALNLYPTGQYVDLSVFPPAGDAKPFPNRSSAPKNETAPVGADAVTSTETITYDSHR